MAAITTLPGSAPSQFAIAAPKSVVDLESSSREQVHQADVLESCRWLAKHPVRQGRGLRGYLVAKRVTDLLLVLISAVVWLPVVLLAALAIGLEAPRGSILFSQKRTGYGTRRFEIKKFRSMVPNAEELKAQLMHLNLRTWPDFKVDPDPRVTRVGRFLRSTSIDELPQILNVLKGEMSLVGPRPTTLPPEKYQPWQLARFDGPSGLTGLWQIVGRSDPSFDRRIQLDLAYLERASWRLDVEIILRTITQVVRRGGA